jgi:hypothetical protein
MRRSWIAVVAALVFLMVASTATIADPAGPGPGDDPAEPGAGTDGLDPTDLLALREEAVTLVLAQDPRFADALDFERQAALASSNFDPSLLLASDYYRELPTLASSFTPWMYDFGYPANRLIEVTLVEGCAALPAGEGPSSETLPWPNPCEWRHSWFYRVAPDDTVTLLFEEGHPDPMPAE